jgi:hypothetical protein
MGYDFMMDWVWVWGWWSMGLWFFFRRLFLSLLLLLLLLLPCLLYHVYPFILRVWDSDHLISLV